MKLPAGGLLSNAERMFPRKRRNRMAAEGESGRLFVFLTAVCYRPIADLSL